MRHSPSRRALLAASLLAATSTASRAATRAAEATARLDALERANGGRLGVAALNTADGVQVNHRADERFAFCSTFKVLSVSAVLTRSVAEAGLLQRPVAFAKTDLVAYSPVTQNHVGTGMTVAELCAAALQYSDNTAANLIIRLLGGPAAVTQFARTIGDDDFRLDRMETALNTAVPGDPRDSTTPSAMRRDLHTLALGPRLGAPQQAWLIDRMKACVTGTRRIRAGVPPGWQVADKTGTGDFGTTNDVGLLWPPGRKPIVLVVYYTQATKTAAPREAVVEAATRIVVEAFG